MDQRIGSQWRNPACNSRQGIFWLDSYHCGGVTKIIRKAALGSGWKRETFQHYIRAAISITDPKLPERNQRRLYRKMIEHGLYPKCALD